MSNALDEAKKIVASVLKIDKTTINDEADLFSLGLVNSVDFVELVMLIERKIQHKLTLPEILELSTIRKISALL